MGFDAILNNKYITTPLLIWFFIQSFKVVHDLIVLKKFNIKRFVGAGGMPSSHSALVCSFATVVAKYQGMEGPLFGMSVLFAVVVMYDASGVRRAAGKQARVLNQIIQSKKDEINIQEKLIELLGHSPFEVLVGALLGIGVTLLIL